MTLTELLADEDFRFKMRFGRSDPADFFKPTANRAALLAERKQWLLADPLHHAALVPEGEALVDEAIRFALGSGTLTESLPASVTTSTPWERCLHLGMGWEPDFLLLRKDASGRFRLVAGCVCFPSSWSLEEKIGHPLEAIHQAVPQLNASLADQIHGFLSKMKPGVAWLRSNWGLSRSIELNQRPARGLPRLDPSVTLDEAWLRVEDQALVMLPETSGILFGIRIAVHSLSDLKRDAEAAARLSRALRTMPEDMARYKGLASSRQRLVQLLDSAS